MTGDRTPQAYGRGQAGADVTGDASAEAVSDQLIEQLTADVHTRLASALTRLLGDAQAADQALAESACLLEGGTLAWRLDLNTLVIELFCDIGLPAPGQVEAAYRQVLEANLCRHYPGVYVGVHPESGRLVATSAPPAVLMLDEEVCVQALESLAGHARQLRETLSLSLCPSGMDLHGDGDDGWASSNYGRGDGTGLA